MLSDWTVWWAVQKSQPEEPTGWQQRNIRRRNAGERSYVCSNEEAFFCPGLQQSPCHCALNFSWAKASAYCAEDHSATKQNVLHRHPIAFMPSPSWSSSSTWSNSPAAYCLLQSPAAVDHVPLEKVMCRTGLCTAQHAKNLSRACFGYAASSYNWLRASETRSHCVCHLQREGECCSDHNRHRSLWCYNAQNPAWHFLWRIGERVRSCKCQRGRKNGCVTFIQLSANTRTCSNMWFSLSARVPSMPSELSDALEEPNIHCRFLPISIPTSLIITANTSI